MGPGGCNFVEYRPKSAGTQLNTLDAIPDPFRLRKALRMDLVLVKPHGAADSEMVYERTKMGLTTLRPSSRMESMESMSQTKEYFEFSEYTRVNTFLLLHPRLSCG